MKIARKGIYLPWDILKMCNTSFFILVFITFPVMPTYTVINVHNKKNVKCKCESHFV